MQDWSTCGCGFISGTHRQFSRFSPGGIHGLHCMVVPAAMSCMTEPLLVVVTSCSDAATPSSAIPDLAQTQLGWHQQVYWKAEA